MSDGCVRLRGSLTVVTGQGGASLPCRDDGGGGAGTRWAMRGESSLSYLKSFISSPRSPIAK